MENEMSPHKHSELIKKWADDDSIVIQSKMPDGAWVDSSYPCWNKTTEYRIKPETIRYRVALMYVGTCNYAQSVNDESEAAMLYTGKNFIKWLTDWIEVEI
jgi:hypothetical protein